MLIPLNVDQAPGHSPEAAPTLMVEAAGVSPGMVNVYVPVNTASYFKH